MKTSVYKITKAIICAASVTLPTFIAPASQASSSVVTQCDETGLLEAIKNTPSGGTIEFNCAPDSTIYLNSEIVLNKSLILDGTGAQNLSMSGQKKNRIFRTTKSLTLKSLTLTEGNVANRVGNFSCEGGAVHISFGKLILENVVVKNNFAPRGGGICANWQANVEVVRSSFDNNRGHQGGAMFTNTTDLSIQDSTFTQNSTQPGQNLLGTGGAVMALSDLNKSTPITISRSRFDGNKGYQEGGSIFIGQNNGTNFELRDSTFVNNEALLNTSTGIGSGGAVKLSHGGSQSTANITNVIFANNIADQEGGGVWAGGVRSNLNLNFDNVTFYGNKSGRIPDPALNETAGGGLLLAIGTGKATFNYTTFTRNNSGNETGGAMWVDPMVNPQNVIIQNSVFDRNCSLKDIIGTPVVENCNHLVHANNTRGAYQDLGNQNNYEWIANYGIARKIDRPLTLNINRKDVNVRVYVDNGDALPDHPDSDVNSGARKIAVRRLNRSRKTIQNNKRYLQLRSINPRRDIRQKPVRVPRECLSKKFSIKCS
jgi:hypothetical protein